MSSNKQQTNYTFTLREPQKPLQALLMSSTANVLAAGSSRVGKSWLFMLNAILIAQAFDGCRIGIFRRHRNSCEKQLFKITLDQVLRSLGLAQEYAAGKNKSDLTLTLPNGSVLVFGGLDKDDKEKELGSEYQIIWMNETTQFTYEDVEFMRGRLNGDIYHPVHGHKLQHKMWFDCNPDTFDDWEYKLFVQKIQPLTKRSLQAPEDYAYVQMVTDDEDYIRRNIDQSDEWKQRFIYANWTASNPNAMFNRKMINDNRYEGSMDGQWPKGLAFRKVVVGVDPAVSSNANSDHTGIIVAGIDYKGECYVLADYSTQSLEWENEVIRAFDEWQADLIIAERNQGGFLVEKAIRAVRRNASYESVWAVRGKDVRADPIASKYRQGHVHHVGELDELEAEMVSFDPSNVRRGGSPDRMDACVWALWKLFDISGDAKQPGRASVTYTSLF